MYGHFERGITVSFQPSPQQRAIIDGALRRESMVVQARAGTGKTTTMAQLSWAIHQASRGNARIGYIAYNKSVQIGAQGKFSPLTDCRTAHSLAWRAVGRFYAHRRGASGDIKPWFIPSWLGFWKGFKVTGVNRDGLPIIVKGGSIARLAKDTVKKFCESADMEIMRHHVPLPREINGAVGDRVRELALRSAEKMWADLVDLNGSAMTFSHDHYLKIFGMEFVKNGWSLPYDVIILDEAQDANPIISQIYQTQLTKGTQGIAIGDSCQSIYGWRGATDTLEMMASQGAPVRYLTQSYRFGEAIAAAGNLWLDIAGFDVPVIGSPQLDGHRGELDQDSPHAVICRTNSGCVDAAIQARQQGRSVHLVGGTEQSLELVKEITKLVAGQESTHPKLMAFPTYGKLLEFLNSGMNDDNELALADRLLTAYGADRLEATLSTCLTPRVDAHTVISTAHKFKGDEHRQVRIGTDFVEPIPSSKNPTGRPTKPDCMLNYVAVTRALEVLDDSALAWGANYC
jgi:hypothetical protein